MPFDAYRTALKYGKRDISARAGKKLATQLPCLDDILKDADISGEVPLGLLDIPTELIVGTKTRARTNSFAPNFMPILEEGSEFAMKWIFLYTSHISEGIREPIAAYEYLNKYYVLEGNKRVSVLKFSGADSVPGYVTRVIPAWADTPQIRLYYESMEFFNISNINYISFSREGSYLDLCRQLNRPRNQRWTPDERMEFRSCYVRFCEAFLKLGGGKINITAGDAMLSYLHIHGYERLRDETPAQIAANLKKMWEEVRLTEIDHKASIRMSPPPEYKKTILGKLSAADGDDIDRIAFIHTKDAKSSGWTYSHELGRMHVDHVLGGKVATAVYDNVSGEREARRAIEKAISDGNGMIFTTTPEFLSASLKAAVNHPKVKILNCSLTAHHKYIRTYYARMYEASFLIGVLSGIMSRSGRIGYIANYPIYGMPANINAFAVGVRSSAPNAKIYLRWSTLSKNRGEDPADELLSLGVDYISHHMIPPREADRRFGLYRVEDGRIVNLAYPVWNWGKFYERIIRNARAGQWTHDAKFESRKALLYYWGMSADVIDVLFSPHVPEKSRLLLDILKGAICRHDFNPLDGVLYSQDGTRSGDPDHRISAEEIMSMDWLLDNIDGFIPGASLLRSESQAVVLQEGVRREDESSSQTSL